MAGSGGARQELCCGAVKLLRLGVLGVGLEWGRRNARLRLRKEAKKWARPK